MYFWAICALREMEANIPGVLLGLSGLSLRKFKIDAKFTGVLLDPLGP